MLDELRVTNLGLIESAALEPGPGLVVVSGETGTGKTLLLGALRLLLGEQAGQNQIGPGGEEAAVEGRFVDAQGGEYVAVRRVVEGGRSRAYLDGAMVPAKVLAERSGGVVEIVAQHDQLTLLSTQGVRRLVDSALDDDGRDALSSYAAAWERLRRLQGDLALLGGDRHALERELEIVRFQAEEISNSGFRPGEEEGLTARVNRLRNVGAIAESLGMADRALSEDDGAMSGLGAAVHELRRAARLDGGLLALSEQAELLAALAADLAADLARAADDLEDDPGELATLEQRIGSLNELKRKYGDTLDLVFEFGEAATRRAAELTRLLDRAGGLSDEIAKAEAVVGEEGARLRSARRRSALSIAAQAATHLRELGFATPVVVLDVVEAKPARDGADTVRLRFASDDSLEPGPVGKVASGGELSRLVLALRLASGVADAAVIAFDEIDAGVGGATALALGRMLADLAAQRQVLCVTHLPQVAAFADTHYVVEREANRATVRLVDGEDRVAELTRMLSGLPASDKGRQHASELLALAGR